MYTHVCKQCGASFVYCRACVFRPVRYKDAGFCSKECYEASKIEIPKTLPKSKTKAKVKSKPIVEPEIQIIEESMSIEVEADINNDVTEEQNGIHE